MPPVARPGEADRHAAGTPAREHPPAAARHDDLAIGPDECDLVEAGPPRRRDVASPAEAHCGAALRVDELERMTRQEREPDGARRRPARGSGKGGDAPGP